MIEIGVLKFGPIQVLINKSKMKNYLILPFLVVVILFFSCEEVQKEEDTPLEHSTEKLIHTIKENDMEILEIDGCEYIIYKEYVGANHGYGYMAHKGNCKNLIHCYNSQN